MQSSVTGFLDLQLTVHAMHEVGNPHTRTDVYKGVCFGQGTPESHRVSKLVRVFPPVLC